MSLRVQAGQEVDGCDVRRGVRRPGGGGPRWRRETQCRHPWRGIEWPRRENRWTLRQRPGRAGRYQAERSPFCSNSLPCNRYKQQSLGSIALVGVLRVTFLHPNNVDLSLGTPVWEKPLQFNRPRIQQPEIAIPSKSGACATWYRPVQPCEGAEQCMLLHKYHGERGKFYASCCAGGDECGTPGGNGRCGVSGSGADSGEGRSSSGADGVGHAIAQGQRLHFGWPCRADLWRPVVAGRPH